tara:strand:+ start:326 stop:1186 length:861 start_codon:yes stop_codon:yes gene_type:complete
MLKKISFTIYLILKLINNIIKIIFKKNFLLWFYTFIQNDAYQTKNIKGKKISFFCPNHLILFRIETFYSKEPETISWIESFRKQKNKKIIFWDIGANIGVYSIYSSIFHKNKIEITSFEPSVNNLRVLSRNISINKLSNNISINQLPICDKEGEYIQFVESSFNEGAAFHNLNLSKKRNKYNQNESIYKIFSTNLNNLANQKNFKYPNYIKIDIDGNEKFILDGAKKIFNNSNLKSVLIELDEKNKNFKYIENFFKKNKFKLISKNNPPLFISKKENIKNFIFERN